MTTATRFGLTLTTCLAFSGGAFGQFQIPGAANPQVGGGVRAVQRWNGVGNPPQNFGGIKNGLQQNLNLSALSNLNAAANIAALNRGNFPGGNPFGNAFGGWNPYNAGFNPYNGGFNPNMNPYNSGFGYPGQGYFPQNYGYGAWSPYNQFASPWNAGFSPYANPYGNPYGFGANYALPPWYNGVSPAPVVGVSGQPFGFFPGVQ